jgi:hypothetical protein|nr:MAG TPA: hypothetical protein [Caudoviricetes sp.]
MTDKNKELEILFPTAEIEVAGEKLEVKEYTLKQQLQYNAKFMPFINALRATLGNSQEDFSLDDLMVCLSANYQNVMELVAISINKPVEFVESLGNQDGEALLIIWWGVNSDFFTRKAVQPLVEKSAKANLAKWTGVKL